VDAIAVEFAHQVGKKHETSTQDTDHDEIAGVTAFFGHFLDHDFNALFNLLFGEEDIFYMMRLHVCSFGWR